jgi:hypothetical protein
MRIATRALGAAGFLLSLFSCVGDEPTAQRPTVTADGGLRDTGTSQDPDGQIALKCPAPEQACASGCANTSSSVDNCGTCGRSCGGGTCTGGVCGVATVRADIEGLNNFAVDEQNVYFTSGNLVQSCKSDACSGVPKPLASMESPAYGIEIDSGFVYFQSENSGFSPAIFRCDTATGCDATLQPLASAGNTGLEGFVTFGKSVFFNIAGNLSVRDCSNGDCQLVALQVSKPVGKFFAADANRIYVADKNLMAASYSCPRTEKPCVTKTSIASGTITNNVSGPMVVAQNRIFFISSPSSGQSLVLHCPLDTACGSPGKLSPISANMITSLVADSKGIYWADDDVLKGCADTTCAGGVKTVATGMTGTTQLRLSSSFVYVAIPGMAGAKGVIKRIAR